MRPTQQTRRRRWIAVTVRTAVGLALLAAAGAIFAGLVVTRPTPPMEPRGRAAAVVEVIETTPVSVRREWMGTGQARALKKADVAAEVAGVITEMPDQIDAGRSVSRGDLIVAIDARDYQERLNAASQAIASTEAQVEALDVEQESLQDWVALAEEEVEFARRELQRALDAQKRGVATQSEIDALERDLRRTRRVATEVRQRLALISPRRQELQAQLLRLRAEAEQARLDVDRSRVTAPIDGVLQDVHVKYGERVAVGEPVARVVNLSEIEIPLRLPVSAGANVAVGAPVTIEADGPSGLSWRGEIVRAAPEADAQTRTLTMYAEISQPAAAPAPGMLLPGQFVIGRIASARASERIIVPRRAVQGDHVLVAVGDSARVERRFVEVAHYLEGRYERISPEDQEWAVIARGLEPGERVIVSNLQDLQAGELVQARPADGAPVAARDASDGEG